MRHLLVTGGAGFIGRALALGLPTNQWSIRAFDNLHPQIHPDPERSVEDFPGEIIRGDVRDEAALAHSVRGCDAVIHLAAETGVGQSMMEPERYESTNVIGSDNVARVAARSRLALVMFSSRAVYGEGAYVCTSCGTTFGQPCCECAGPRCSREDDPLLPISVYGQTKARAEWTARERWTSNAPLVILRPQNVIGAGQALTNPYTGVLAAFAARVRAGLPLQLYGDGSQTRDFVHVADVQEFVRWTLSSLSSWREPRVFNVGTGRRTTLQELALAVLRQSGGTSVPIEHIDVRRAGDIEHACADVATIANAGAPLPARTLDLAVRDFIAWAWRWPPAPPQLWDRALDELGPSNRLTRNDREPHPATRS